MATSRGPGAGGRPGVLPDGSVADRCFVGGMRVAGSARSFNATVPLAVLELHATGVRIRARGRLLGAYAPVWEAGYPELTEVRAVGRIPLVTTGIRFGCASGDPSWAVFWCPGRERVLRALADRQVPPPTGTERPLS